MTSTSEAKRPMRPNSCSVMPPRRRLVSTPCADEDSVADIEGKEVSRFRIEHAQYISLLYVLLEIPNM